VIGDVQAPQSVKVIEDAKRLADHVAVHESGYVQVFGRRE
jgi:hypothetical protein